MTNKQLEICVKTLRATEAQLKTLEAQTETVRAELSAGRAPLAASPSHEKGPISNLPTKVTRI